MAISERTLHPYIKGLVEEYGALNVTKLNKLLRDILILGSEDLTLLKGRRDDKFSQIVRNVVAHTSETISCHNGYIIDKTQKPAKFYAKVNNDTDVKKCIISDNEIKKRNKNKRAFLARKINFEEINKVHTNLGTLGENFVLEWERNRLKDLNVGFDLLENVIHVSYQYGDGAGYDILSKKDGGFENLFIEVKTTKGGIDTPFFMSANEKLFMEIYKENARLYRVYNYNDKTNIGDIEIIDYDTLDKEYNFDPITFKVTKI